MTVEKNTKQPLINNRFFKEMPQDLLKSTAPTMRSPVIFLNREKEDKGENNEVLSNSPLM